MARPHPRRDPGNQERGAAILDGLTPRQRQLLRHWQAELDGADSWDGDLPVAVLDRCWLRLRRVSLERLTALLPPDASGEAPELARYRHWLARGLAS